jgi:hypothetical protein
MRKRRRVIGLLRHRSSSRIYTSQLRTLLHQLLASRNRLIYATRIIREILHFLFPESKKPVTYVKYLTQIKSAK